MTISEYIEKMTAIKSEAGDIEVVVRDYPSIRATRGPRLAEECILTKRERNRKIWHSYDGPEKRSGQRVVVIE